MSQASRIDERAMARRVAREIRGGQAVALGAGLPGLVPGQMPLGSGVFFLADSGVVGYAAAGVGWQAFGLVDSSGGIVSLAPGAALLSLVDLSGLIRGGHVDLAVTQPSQVSARGDFTHWTTSATPGMFPPGNAVDYGCGPLRLVAMMRHTGDDGAPNIVADCSGPIDGSSCVDLIVTDIGVISAGADGLTLREVAPGWRAGDVAALTGAPLTTAPNLSEMELEVDRLEFPSKVFASGPEAVRDLPSGATVMIDGFAGPGGMPHYLMTSLRDQGAGDLTIISNTAGVARVVNFGTPAGRIAIDHSILIDNRQVKKAIASYPVSPSASNPSSFELAYRRGEVELELVPQGTLAERLRAGGAGVAAFYTPTGVGTLIAEGKESRVIDGKEYLLEHGIRADFCLIRGHQADTLGNVVYRGTSRNFNSVMAPAARITIVEVDEILEAGALDPEAIVTPGIYINRIVRRPEDFSPYE